MTTETRLRYEPALDGLRAVAVLAVIAYHDAYSWAEGGFLGVDAFFVLSGFLITTLLILEFQRAQTIDLLAFWGRRLRRLLPALLLVLLAVSIYGALEVPSIELSKLRGDSLAGLFYVANWQFIATGASYFEMFSAPSPVRHLWSLAIEEQFYLVWPLVVLACFKLFRGSQRAVLGVAVVGVIASSIVMASLYDSADPSRAYFGTDARIHTILVGAVLAVILLNRPPTTAGARGTVQVLGIVGAVGMVWSMHSLSDQSSAYYHGGSLVFAVAVAALIAAAMQPTRSVLRLGLALAPLVWIGRISYGLYLWHWPVNVYLTEARVGFGGSSLNLLRLAVTFAFAVASYYLVEMPIRRGVLRARDRRVGWRPWRSRAPASPSWPRRPARPPRRATSEAVRRRARHRLRPPPGHGSAPSRHPRGRSTTARSAARASTSAPAARWPSSASSSAHPRSRTSARPRPTRCAPARHHPHRVPAVRLRVLVIGDSLGCSVAVGLGPAGAPALVAQQATIVGCGVVSDQVYDEEEPFPQDTDRCHRFVEELQGEAIERFRPDVVLWISTWERFNLVEGGRLLPTGTESWKASLQRRIAEASARITASGARLVLVTVAAPAPASMIDGGRIVSPAFDWKFAAMNEQLERYAAEHPETALIDVAAKICPRGAPCPAQAAGLEPRHGDGVHFDPPGSVWLGRWMLPQILAAAPPAPVAP